MKKYKLVGGKIVYLDKSIRKKTDSYVHYLDSYRNFSQIGTCVVFGYSIGREMLFGDSTEDDWGKAMDLKDASTYREIDYPVKLARFVRS